MFDTLDISASALLAQRVRMDTIAGNIANLNTTRSQSSQGQPYRRRFVIFGEGQGPRGADAARPGVHVAKVGVDPGPFLERYEPGHPDAGPNGMVLYPNIDLAKEFVNAMEASRAYEANITTMEVTKNMMNATLRLLA